MKTTAILASAVIAMGIFVGCDTKTETPVADKAPSKDAVQSQVDKAVAPLAGTATDMAAKATDTTKAAVADATAEATKLLDQVKAYVKDNKWELADTTLAKLEGMKASLPATITDQLPNLRKAIDAGKAMKLPGM